MSQVSPVTSQQGVCPYLLKDLPSLMPAFSFRAKNVSGDEGAPGGRVRSINMGVYRMCVMLEQRAVKTVSNNFQKLLNVFLTFIHKHGSFPTWPTLQCRH